MRIIDGVQTCALPIFCEALKVEVAFTALGTDEASSLIAVGTSSGELLLLKLDIGGSVPRLDVLSRTSTYDLESRTDVLAVMLRDEGRQLVTVNWLPESKRDDHPANIAGQPAEDLQWKPRDWTRKRTIPFPPQTTPRAP